MSADTWQGIAATGPEVSNILLGEASAQLIANALFGMCRWKGDLSADEGKVARTLSNEVNDAIKTRNDFAHGDWIIAPSAMQEGRIRSLDARIIRILPARSEGPTKVMDLSVDKLDGMSDRLIVLTGLLEDFAKLALKFLVLEPLDEGGQETRGKYRVSDVLTPVHGKGKAARVARDGPHAERLTIGPHSTYGRCAPFWAGSAGHR